MGAPPPPFRILLLTFIIPILATLASAMLASNAFAQDRPVLSGIDVLKSADEIQVLFEIDGGAPAATQIRFTSGGRVMVLEIAGVENRMDRRNIQVRDPRLDRIRIEDLPGGIQISIIAGQTAEPFAGRQLVPVALPTGLTLTIWQAGATTLPPLPAAGLPYDVSEIQLVYAKDHPEHPDLEEIRRTTFVTVGLGPDGFVGPQAGGDLHTFALSDVPAPHKLVPSSIRSISEAIVEAFNKRGIAGVYVEPHPDDIDPESNRDLRKDKRRLRMLVWTGRLLEFRTFASGTRVSEEESVDNPVHARIKSASPVQPGDLLTKRKIDEYVARMNRHPGRVIDTSLSSAGEPGGAYLDYLVNDKRPWKAYAQVSNTGTDGTGELRERFGFTHTQVTNRDDILQLDYITGDFDTVHAFFGSYDVPLIWDNRVRFKLTGSYVEYDASQLAQTVQFSGEQWFLSGELKATVFQYDDWFLDVFGGLKWQNISVRNVVVGFVLPGESDFFLPEIGFAIEHRTAPFTITGEISNVWNASDAAGTDDFELGELGLTRGGSADFEILRWNLQASAYIDALLADPDSTLPLVHEIFVSSRGQYAWDNRLAPQFQDVSTGLYSVRGYPQSVAAGDDLFLGRFEYRLHLARLLPVRPTPIKLPWGREFRLQPDGPNRIPDWDLVLRGFFDIGRTNINKPSSTEGDQRLMGAGVGVDLRILENFVFTADYGFALKDLKSGAVESGDQELYLTGTILY